MQLLQTGYIYIYTFLMDGYGDYKLSKTQDVNHYHVKEFSSTRLHSFTSVHVPVPCSLGVS